jgi:hypothetical protein
MCETADFLVEVVGFAVPSTAEELEESVKLILESLRIDARNTWQLTE